MSDDSQRPSLATVIETGARRVVGRINVSMDAVVVSYDRTTQTCTVRPSVSAYVDTDAGREYQAVPLLANVPIRWPSSGIAGITWDLEAGDNVMLIVRDRSHDEVDAGGQKPTQPVSGRRFDWSDAVAWPCQARASVGDGALAGVVWRLRAAKRFLFGASTASKALALAEVCDANMATVYNSFANHTHTVAGTCPPGGGPLSGGVTGPGNDFAYLASGSSRVFTDG